MGNGYDEPGNAGCPTDRKYDQLLVGKGEEGG